MNLCVDCGAPAVERRGNVGPIPKKCAECRKRKVKREGPCVDCGVTIRRKSEKATGRFPERCDACKKKRAYARISTYQRKLWAENPELWKKERLRRTQQMRRWRAANPEKARELTRNSKRREAADPARSERRAAVMRSNRLQRYYGLTVERYDEILAEQGGVCAICKEPPKPEKRLHIDHDHACCASKKSCGKCIRGLLCDFCNNGLGRFRDRPDLLLAAAQFLSR